MGCKYSDWDGKCTLFWNEEEGELEIYSNGVDEEGNCICEEDPDPTILCENYEES